MNDVKTHMVKEMYAGHMKFVDRELERLIAYMAALLDVPVLDVLKVIDDLDAEESMTS
jgi:hypothetical protein